MSRETIADLKVKIAVLEERLSTKSSALSRSEERNKILNEKVSTMRAEIVEFKAERDRLVGYVHRIQDEETPPERRRAERRRDLPPVSHFDSGTYDEARLYPMGKASQRIPPWHE